MKEALAALAQGKTGAAKAIFAKTVEAKAAEGAAGAAANREAAEAALHLGALAFLDNITEEALRWNRRAVELDPGNADGWNLLGLLYLWTGQLDQAEATLRKVVTLGEANGDMEAIAAGTGGLGLLYGMRVSWTEPRRCSRSRSPSTRSSAARTAWPTSTATSGPSTRGG